MRVEPRQQHCALLFVLCCTPYPTQVPCVDCFLFLAWYVGGCANVRFQVAPIFHHNDKLTAANGPRRTTADDKSGQPLIHLPTHSLTHPFAHCSSLQKRPGCRFFFVLPPAKPFSKLRLITYRFSSGHSTICIIFPFLFLFSHSSLPSRLHIQYPPSSLIPSTHPQLPTLDPHSNDTPIAINNGSFIIHLSPPFDH